MRHDRALTADVLRAFGPVLACALLLSGCQAWSPVPTPPPAAIISPASQVFVPVMDRELIWEQVVDIVDDYFRIQREDRVRLVGDLLTEGSLITYPRGGSTLLEPWNEDSVNFYERLESTLQSIRRVALVRVIPAEGGFLIDVEVKKELENVPRPETGAISLANPSLLRNDNSLHRVTNPVAGAEPTIDWIPQGRDIALEQVMLTRIQACAAGQPN